MIRGCSSDYWIPPNGIYESGSANSIENCIKDKFSLELFCFCQKDICNGNNTGVQSIYSNATFFLFEI